MRTILAIAALMMSSLLASCGPGTTEPGQFRRDKDMAHQTDSRYTLAEIEAIARLHIPASAAGVDSYLIRGGMDSYVALKFSLPAEDLESFLNGAGYLETLKPLDAVSPNFGDLQQKMQGWPSWEQWQEMLNDESIKLLGLDMTEPGFSRQIIVDQSDPALYVIYLVHFET